MTTAKRRPTKRAVKRATPVKRAKRQVTKPVGLEPDGNVPPELRTEEDERAAELVEKALLDEIIDLQRSFTPLVEEHRAKRSDLTERMKEDNRKRLSTDKGKAVLVAPENMRIDEAKLKKRLGAARWAKVTTRTLDKVKLDAAVRNGDIDLDDVAQCTDVTPGTTYVKITPK